MPQDYLIVYQPKKELGFKKRRFLISPKRVSHYIGQNNADTVILKASNLRTDNERLKFRKFGIIDIYVK